MWGHTAVNRACQEGKADVVRFLLPGFRLRSPVPQSIRLRIQGLGFLLRPQPFLDAAVGFRLDFNQSNQCALGHGIA